MPEIKIGHMMDQTMTSSDTNSIPTPTSDYERYRGRCLELSKAAVAENPQLRLVRGYYTCPIWNSVEPHWWTAWPDGTIHDPSRLQFPSKGLGFYQEFDGTIDCSNCGKTMREEEADIDGNYAFCSYKCHGRFVGVL